MRGGTEGCALERKGDNGGALARWRRAAGAHGSRETERGNGGSTAEYAECTADGDGDDGEE